MIEDANQNQTLYYTCTDHLGSITALVDVNGNIAEEYSYDAWGRRRNPTDWTFDNVPASQTITRGYTGHEHLDCFGLINMNGRIYDPVLGRFAQPDILVQAPGYTQSFNRYSYCFNNPLVYTDPSGYHNEPMYNPHGYNYNFDIAGYFDGIYWLSSANYDISGPYAGLFDPSVSNGGGSSGGAPAYNQGASMGNSDQQIKLDGYSDFEYKQYTKALTAWRKGQDGDPHPFMAWDRKNGVIAFGVVVEGSGGSGGLMGAGGHDPSGNASIDWSFNGAEVQNTITLIGIMTGVYSLAAAETVMSRAIATLSLGSTVLSITKFDYNANIELGIIKSSVDAFTTYNDIKMGKWQNIPLHVNSIYQDLRNWFPNNY